MADSEQYKESRSRRKKVLKELSDWKPTPVEIEAVQKTARYLGERSTGQGGGDASLVGDNADVQDIREPIEPWVLPKESPQRPDVGTERSGIGELVNLRDWITYFYMILLVAVLGGFLYAIGSAIGSAIQSRSS